MLYLFCFKLGGEINDPNTNASGWAVHNQSSSQQYLFDLTRDENGSALKYVVFLYVQKNCGIKLFCVCNILQLKFPVMILFSD